MWGVLSWSPFRSSCYGGIGVRSHEYAGFDVVMPEFSVLQESAALSCEIDWGGRDRMPDARNFPQADFSDIHVPEDFLEKKSVRVVPDALEILRAG